MSLSVQPRVPSVCIRFVLLLSVFSIVSCAGQRRRLVINVDDVGMSTEINQGTEKAIQSGLVTSASIMVPAPAFEEAILLSEKYPEISWGIHLTLTSEWDIASRRWGPILDPASVPSLVDRDGFLRKTTRGVMNFVRIADAEKELRAQIDEALAQGIKVTHLDTHMYALFTRGDLFDLYLQLSIDYNIPALLFLKSGWERENYQQNWNAHIEYARSAKLPIADYYNGKNYIIPPDKKKSYLLEVLRQIPEGTSIIVFHPASQTFEFSKEIPDSASRYKDLELLQDSDVRRLIEAENIKLIKWEGLNCSAE